MNSILKKTAAGFTAALIIFATACGTKPVAEEPGKQEAITPTVSVEATQTPEVKEPEQNEPQAQEEYKILKKGDVAPDFTATLTDGSTFTLSEHKDEVVLINFWATWCPPCVAELPDFEKLAGENIDNFTLIAVNCTEDEKTVDAFIEKNGYTFKVAYDADYTIGMKYPTDGIPYTVIVKDGIITMIYLGRNSYETFKKAIEENLGK